ncbi:poly-beta-1,6 N-acetyl-D-glucosamine export porin PgaA [Modicisalibacter radicis]|uniref:poly-beta-1,6 N-acetyl-D-glucosamine export porin PgaA n=1 Tax=Halomonas sp. EAR18 TaxID=2518972 RepID=UPI00109D7952|nr:poly-beta-1,6 N-acetyl-D-glucosamine export porin PgaA [Halomonas sp. EAR18]
MNLTRSLLCAVALLAANATLAQSDLDSQREAWIIMARQGQLDEAIDGLSRLYAQTGDRVVLDDLIALMVRDGRYQQALDACAQCHIDDYSNVSLEALGRAARLAGEYQHSLDFYQTLTFRDPNNAQGWLGIALTNIDQGYYESANWALTRYEERFGRTDGWFETRAYLAARNENPIAELQARQLLIERQPRNEAEIKALYRLAITLGAHSAAERLMQESPQLFTETDRLWLRYYDAVSKMRLADSTNEVIRAEAGLTELESVIATQNADPGLAQRAQYDRVVALATLRRFEEAEALAAQLEVRYGPLPNYVLEARADALSGLGRPREARDIYASLIASNPNLARAPDQPRYESLIYAYADARQYDDAERVLEKWEKAEPASRWDFTGTRRIANLNYERVRHLDVMLSAWRGDEDVASERLDNLIEQAPANASLWRIKGDLSRWRGWPRQAEEDYQRAAQLSAPDNRNVPTYGVLMSRLDRGDWRGNVETIEQRIEQDPPSVSLDGLARELREQRAGRLSVKATHGDSTGSGVQSSHDWRYEALLEAPRNEAGSRFFAQRIGMYGEYDGEPLYAAYTAVGYEFNLYPATVKLAVGDGVQLNEDPLIWSELSYAFSDYWTGIFSVEINSAETPLRALRDGVYADLYRLEGRYRRDESGTGGIGLAFMDLEDGNLRRAISGYWTEEIYGHDEWNITGQLFAGTSKNDEVEASYFNPRQDASASGEFEFSHTLPLGYRKSLVQALTLGGGRYWQEDYGSEPTWAVGYQHSWEFEPDVLFEYGISRQKSVYDGVPEYGNFITAGFEWRFL